MSIRVNGKVIASNGDVKTETDNLVTTDTNQTITGIKTFTNSPIVPTPAEGSSGQEVVNVEWVNANMSAIYANVSLSNLSAAGQAKFDAKANAANTVTTDTDQTITGFKAFNSGSGNNRTNIDIITNDGVAEDANTKWAGSIQFKKGNVDVGYCEAMKDSANSSIAQIVAHNSVNGQRVYSSLKAVVTSDGYTFAMASSPSAGAIGEEIVTARWFNTKMQVVSALPAEPDPNVFYFIPE